MAQIYDSSHSGQEIDAAVDAVQTTIPSQVTQIGSKIGDLTELETTDKTDLVSAINEVKNNASTTAEDTSYTDNYGIGATNVQDAIDKVGFVGTDTEIDLTEFTEVRAWIGSNLKWVTTNDTYPYYGVFVPVTAGKKYRIIGNSEGTSTYAFMINNIVGSNNSAVKTFADDSTKVVMELGQTVIATAPSDAQFMWVGKTVDGVGDRLPQKIEVLKESVAEVLSDEDVYPIKGKLQDIRQNADLLYTSRFEERIDISSYSATANSSYINMSSGVWASSANTKSFWIPVEPDRMYKICAKPDHKTRYALCKTNVTTTGTYPDYATGETIYEIQAGGEKSFLTPSDAAYMRVQYTISAADALPESIQRTVTVGSYLDMMEGTVGEDDIVRNGRYTADGSTAASVGFLHFSDIHGDSGAAKAIRAFYDKYQGSISDMLCTGDIPYFTYSDGIAFYVANRLTDALLALGNHDGYDGSSWDGMGAQTDYETYYAPYISGWNVTQPTDAATNHLMYYYKDYASASLRLIVLDVMHQDAAQLQWFTDTLAAARTSGYAVIVASHYIPNTFTEEYIVKRADGEKTNFHYYLSNSLTTIDGRFKLDTVYADAVEAFISAGGEFVVWLCGHYHTDYFTYSNTHPNILFCAINQAGYRRGGSQGYRQIGDHCANFVSVHKALGLVKIYRIGLKTDKFLRPINVLTYDYVNKKVVTNY